MINIPSIDDMNRLVEQGLASGKQQSQNGDYFNIFKYKNEVFYKNLWNVNDALLESRGIVFNSDGKIVQLPLRKVFNYGENGTYLDLNEDVICHRKYNGFMLAVTRYNGRLVFSTTGSLESSYVHLGMSLFAKFVSHGHLMSGYTYIFEVCTQQDPHIVDEGEGVYLLAVRDKTTGMLLDPSTVNRLSQDMTGHRLSYFKCKFGDVVEKNKTATHEGYMVADPTTNQHILKLKSPHYLSKKFLMRMGGSRVDEMFNNPQSVKRTIDEEFYGIVDFVTEVFDDASQWRSLSDQERKQFIEDNL